MILVPTFTQLMILFIHFRLAHDISPDSYPSDDSEDGDTDLKREKFLFECLSQATTNINNNNSITHLAQTVCDTPCDKTENITETFTKLKRKEEQLERINNEINKNHLTKEDHNNHINLINNNYLKVGFKTLFCLQKEADKERERESKKEG